MPKAVTSRRLFFPARHRYTANKFVRQARHVDVITAAGGFRPYRHCRTSSTNCPPPGHFRPNEASGCCCSVLPGDTHTRLLNQALRVEFLALHSRRVDTLIAP